MLGHQNKPCVDNKNEYTQENKVGVHELAYMLHKRNVAALDLQQRYQEANASALQP